MKFKPGDLICMPDAYNCRFNCKGITGKVDKVMDVEDGEQMYGVSLWMYGADHKYKVKESQLVKIEDV